MVAAIEHPLVDAIGHPTGRKIEKRAALRRRHRARDRGRGAHGHDARDQRLARPPRSQRDPRPRGGRGRRADPDRLRRPLDAELERCATASRPPGGLADAPSRSPTRARGRSSRRCASARVNRRRAPVSANRGWVGSLRSRSATTHELLGLSPLTAHLDPHAADLASLNAEVRPYGVLEELAAEARRADRAGSASSGEVRST